MNAPLGVSEMVRGKPLYSDAFDKMTSVIAYVYKNHSLVFVGTKSGRIKKVRGRNTERCRGGQTDRSRDLVSLYRNSEQGLGIRELLAIPGRVVVVGQIDFQAIQLSRLYLKEEELHVYVCITERESEGELSVHVCLCFEEGRSGEAPREFYFWSLSGISHILLSRCNIYHTYTCIQRAS